MHKKEYQMGIKRGALVFSTSSFNAEGGSVLPIVIFNRELTASLASGAVLAGIGGALAFIGVKFSLAHYISAAVFFGLLTLVFRVYVFVEERLDAVLDPERGRVSVSVNGLKGLKLEEPLSALRSIRKGYTIIVPDNPDGIGVVQRIASQHGMSVHGFGDPREFHSVVFEFQDGTPVIVFTSEDAHEASAVLEMMKNFIGESIAKAD